MAKMRWSLSGRGYSTKKIYKANPLCHRKSVEDIALSNMVRELKKKKKEERKKRKAERLGRIIEQKKKDKVYKKLEKARIAAQYIEEALKKLKR